MLLLLMAVTIFIRNIGLASSICALLRCNIGIHYKRANDVYIAHCIQIPLNTKMTESALPKTVIILIIIVKIIVSAFTGDFLLALARHVNVSLFSLDQQ